MPARVAQAYLNKYWDGVLPVDPFAIAKLAGIKVEHVFDMLESGVIKLEDGGPTIQVHMTESELRQRFTVAHEIGHFAMNHLKENGQRMFRDPVSNFSAAGNQPLERAANQFAAQLLMPADIVRWTVLKKGITNLGDLASAFKVSEVAMRYRLKNLGLLA